MQKTRCHGIHIMGRVGRLDGAGATLEMVVERRLSTEFAGILFKHHFHLISPVSRGTCLAQPAARTETPCDACQQRYDGLRTRSLRLLPPSFMFDQSAHQMGHAAWLVGRGNNTAQHVYSILISFNATHRSTLRVLSSAGCYRLSAFARRYHRVIISQDQVRPDHSRRNFRPCLSLLLDRLLSDL